MTLLWIGLFLLALGGVALAIAGFILLEALALRRADDELYTFSTYWKRAKHKHAALESTMDVTVATVGVTSIIFGAWVIGHLIQEAW